ncbi:hypothetical protein TRFO_13058 [Tritrichomonas foetus]|uniref:Uncharacterized protein n=1 Tax=Tritrichomonas foetus TaxID=1144522 RepID=A0A1J4KZQ5_9EUKA|nr:hypothetical protein TRFO_13058 [Tritrichomonas foetus]|eukprot:OHT16634.1 hypothetical protein TRFO_13058 [Tritrichomonas foetus]
MEERYDDSSSDSDAQQKRQVTEVFSPDTEFTFVPHFITFRSIRLKVGSKFTFQFTLDEEELYFVKLKNKHQTIPIPIGIGKEVHYSGKNRFILTPSKGFQQFVLTDNGTEVFTAQFENITSSQKNEAKSKTDEKNDDKKDSDESSSGKNSQNPIKGFPKRITAKWKPKDGDEINVVSKPPELSETGEYVLDFDGRFAVPSIKNAIFEDKNTGETLMMFRRLDEWEMNCEAVRSMPDIFVFALLISVNVCPF